MAEEEKKPEEMAPREAPKEPTSDEGLEAEAEKKASAVLAEAGKDTKAAPAAKEPSQSREEIEAETNVIIKKLGTGKVDEKGGWLDLSDTSIMKKVLAAISTDDSSAVKKAVGEVCSGSGLSREEEYEVAYAIGHELLIIRERKLKEAAQLKKESSLCLFTRSELYSIGEGIATRYHRVADWANS